MLINTVLLVTRELLPLLLVLVLMLQLQPAQKSRFLLLSVLLSTALVLLLAPWLALLTQLAAGNGLELLFIGCYSVSLLALTALLTAKAKPFMPALLVIAAQGLICGINILLYGLTGIGSVDKGDSYWLGALLALGIGLSIAVLWFHLLDELKRRTPALLLVMLLPVAARQTSEALALLQQTGWLPGGQALWDSSVVISEQSEAGVFLQAWFGYEATPDLIQLTGWLLTLILLSALGYRCYIRRVKNEL
ncbi:hypothetical protein [Rheinheimera sp.]|uniref:hypothetical protein n=1 Tax=Rheinheimera sp. TaxID=1869214 RepID=UPI0027329BBE|nr:hypothetical protein [Rheinheimera sp.]MDP2713621.1 hypothetical protein [Rheinheimera sp.]